MVNDIESYTHEATQCAIATNQRDTMRASSHKTYFNKMRELETAEDQKILTVLFNDTYKLNRKI